MLGKMILQALVAAGLIAGAAGLYAASGDGAGQIALIGQGDLDGDDHDKRGRK